MILPESRFPTICCDPPWSYKTYSKKNQTRSAENHYATMTLEDIAALPVASVAADDCVLLLWATNPMLPQALEVMGKWGFAFKTVGFVWAKTTPKSGAWVPSYHMGLGHWSRANSEMCLLGTRGKPKRVGKGVRQLIVAPRREHSRKPTEFFESVEALLAGPYLDLFSRESRLGWVGWGLEARKYDALESGKQL